ncbi:hypothetical protein BO71DRAFT_120976 [Aspergillus ellipticus CBS 707.79]|uniref:Uncharacterized protein n=1 Tax=Aspergillus ellipticus CBS 707.79 TaxID=1448320 RepID=A0A319DJ62_9EURO|nr:hypothetical protein BO71DRAFT_120976 [Aspergillus ellipticus CBS 707.79]
MNCLCLLPSPVRTFSVCFCRGCASSLVSMTKYAMFSARVRINWITILQYFVLLPSNTKPLRRQASTGLCPCATHPS